MAVEMATALVAVLVPLVGVPLTIITFHLRGLRDDQVNLAQELRRRMEALDTSAAEARRAMRAFEREYTSKEEWLRECMHIRGRLDHLVETTARLSARADRAPQPPDALQR